MHRLSPQQIQLEAERSLQRLLPRLSVMPRRTDSEVFYARLRDQWPRLFALLLELYGERYDFFYHLEQLLLEIAATYDARRPELRDLDRRRAENPSWFQSSEMVGAIAYVDLFAGTLAGLRGHLPYLKELGVTYLHLMPLFRCPAGNSDGGYAVSSYREVDARLGTMAELASLTHEFRNAGISLCLDFVFNHTSDEHAWAQAAKKGDAEFQEFYLTFPDREMPDAYECDLREIFPTIRRGSFTWNEEMQRWVWTTFHSFQWDLNYANPAVFRAMAGEMLFLANQGVEILRLDAVAFIWKQLGTPCENLPQAHSIIQAMNAVVQIAAPALLFKSEAIVHPDEVSRYISPGECQLSYNPLFMALLWESLATREARLLAHSLGTRYRLPVGTAWVNYLRCHDDIGWTFDDEDARRVGIDPFGHRRFLNDFYTGRFPGSFARGVPFQENPETGDARVSGMLASLAGLEAACHAGMDAHEQVDLAVARILMLHGVILAAPGIPLIYLGDEIGQLNDYTYTADEAKAEDSRWVHRPAYNWTALDRAQSDPSTPEGRVFAGLRKLIALRKQLHLSQAQLHVLATGNPHLLGFACEHGSSRLIVIANLTESGQQISGNVLRSYGAAYKFYDLVDACEVSAETDLCLQPYALRWLTQKPGATGL
jgi:amylosucrase